MPYAHPPAKSATTPHRRSDGASPKTTVRSLHLPIRNTPPALAARAPDPGSSAVLRRFPPFSPSASLSQVPADRFACKSPPTLYLFHTSASTILLRASSATAPHHD